MQASSSSPWKRISKPCRWCTAVLSGDRLTVEIEENAEELRNAAISIMNGESVIGKITVEQGIAPTLSLESNTAEFTNEGGGN